MGAGHYHGQCLGQRKVDEKSNEITPIPKLLKLLELSGCIVTLDALGTQRKDNSRQNFAVLRHMALHVLKQEQTVKAGIKAKRLKCG
jgi:predicted transposase YbfD/YdcC